VKLIIAIIQDDYISNVLKTLLENKVRTTKLSSTGGFLKSGNTTLFIGVEDNEIDKVVDLIKAQTKSQSITKGKDEITVGGANLFVMDIDKYVKI
jgi:uncharacterized protein YaaQ